MIASGGHAAVSRSETNLDSIGEWAHGSHVAWLRLLREACDAMTRHYNWIGTDEKAAALSQIASIVRPSPVGGSSGGSSAPGTKKGG